MKTINVFRLVALFVFTNLLASTNLFAVFCSFAITLNSQAEVDAFPTNYSCDSFTYISINAPGVLIDVSPLAQIKYVNRLYIYSDVNDYAGLSNMTGVYEFYIQGPGSVDLLNFPALDTVYRLAIFHGQYSDLDDLSVLTKMHQLQLGVLPNLTNLNGLSNLVSLDNIYIGELPSLNAINIPPAIEDLSILTIRNNTTITAPAISLTSNLTSLKHLEVTRAPNVDFTSLSNIESFSTIYLDDAGIESWPFTELIYSS